MVTAKATRAADKSQICRKFVTALQKLYGKSVPGIEMPVVETMLFAACLEDNSWHAAEQQLKKLLSTYFDLNEIRVSSVSELEATLSELREADWKGLRIRSILRHVFESTYSFDFEKLRRQTIEQAVKTLKKINDITPFIRDFLLHEILSSHIVCLDNTMLQAAKWLGLVPVTADLHEASEFLKGGLKKSEVAEFCYLLRCLATDPRFLPRFAELPGSELSMNDVQDRLLEVQSPPKKSAAKRPAVPEPDKAEKTSKQEKTTGSRKTDVHHPEDTGASIPRKTTGKPSEPVSAAKKPDASKSSHRPAEEKQKPAAAVPTKSSTGKSAGGSPAKPPAKSSSQSQAKSKSTAKGSGGATADKKKSSAAKSPAGHGPVKKK